MNLSERIYRKLLRAYPAWYRRKYEEPMALLFSDQLRAAGTRWKFLRLWLRTLVDFIRTMPVQYFQGPRISYGFDRWATPARRSVFYARYEASSFGRREITTEDLLLGVLREDPPIGRAEIEVIRQEIEATEASPRRTPPMEDLPVSFTLRTILSLAKEEAERQQAGELAPRHLLAGILRHEDSLAAQLLRRHGINVERLRSDA